MFLPASYPRRSSEVVSTNVPCAAAPWMEEFHSPPPSLKGNTAASAPASSLPARDLEDGFDPFARRGEPEIDDQSASGRPHPLPDGGPFLLGQLERGDRRSVRDIAEQLAPDQPPITPRHLFPVVWTHHDQPARRYCVENGGPTPRRIILVPRLDHGAVCNPNEHRRHPLDPPVIMGGGLNVDHVRTPSPDSPDNPPA